MNPLDPEEFSEFLNIIDKNLPIITNESLKVKQSYSQGMPKNIMDHSIKINNKFLNDNLHTIEEINHRDNKNILSNWFKYYQNNIFSDELKHDLFFTYEGKIYPKVSGGSYFNNNSLSFSNASLNRKVFGSTLTVGGTGSDVGISGTIFAGKATGTIGDYYDRSGVNIAVDSTGNIRTGAYQDSSDPADMILYQQSADTATSGTGFNDLALTEFALLTTSVWICMQVSTDTDTISRGGTTDRRVKNQSYGAFPDPLASYTQNLGNTQCPNMRLSHS